MSREPCKLNHNRPVRAKLADDPLGLCSLCIRDRGYLVQRHLGERFSGAVQIVDAEGRSDEAQVTGGFSNAGFRGIEFWDRPTKRHFNAGRIVVEL